MTLPKSEVLKLLGYESRLRDMTEGVLNSVEQFIVNEDYRKELLHDITIEKKGDIKTIIRQPRIVVIPMVKIKEVKQASGIIRQMTKSLQETCKVMDTHYEDLKDTYYPGYYEYHESDMVRDYNDNLNKKAQEQQDAQKMYDERLNEYMNTLMEILPEGQEESNAILQDPEKYKYYHDIVIEKISKIPHHNAEPEEVKEETEELKSLESIYLADNNEQTDPPCHCEPENVDKDNDPSCEAIHPSCHCEEPATKQSKESEHETNITELPETNENDDSEAA